MYQKKQMLLNMCWHFTYSNNSEDEKGAWISDAKNTHIISIINYPFSVQFLVTP